MLTIIYITVLYKTGALKDVLWCVTDDAGLKLKAVEANVVVNKLNAMHTVAKAHIWTREVRLGRTTLEGTNLEKEIQAVLYTCPKCEGPAVIGPANLMRCDWCGFTGTLSDFTLEVL